VVLSARDTFTFLLLAQKKSNKRKGHPTHMRLRRCSGANAACYVEFRSSLFGSALVFWPHRRSSFVFIRIFQL